LELYAELAKWTGWPAIVALILVAGGYAIWSLNNRLAYQKEINAQLEKELGRRATSTKPIKHYLLLWWRGEKDWATEDWNAVIDYVAKFQPTCGFSRLDATNAEMVTIVGADSGVDAGAEKFLNDAGCKVERLDGKTAKDTAELLNRRIHANKAFEGGLHKLGY
jgi:hypothetical protein